MEDEKRLMIEIPLDEYHDLVVAGTEFLGLLEIIFGTMDYKWNGAMLDDNAVCAYLKAIRPTWYKNVTDELKAAEDAKRAELIAKAKSQEAEE